MKTYKLQLVRHGLTQANFDGIYAGGGTDLPLCQQGIEELHFLQQKYQYEPVPVLFSSPMKRALQTAEILFPAASEKIVVEDLRENKFGEFEGQNIEELQRSEKFVLWLNPESGFVPEGGESGAQFTKRTADALKMIFQYMMKNDISKAACVTHGGVIHSMLSQLAVPKQPSQHWMVQSGCGFLLQSTASMSMRDGSVEVIETLPVGYEK